jgi:hypothetical protein
MPVLPGSLKDIKNKQKEIFDTPWATPLTADRSLPLPTLEVRSNHKIIDAHALHTRAALRTHICSIHPHL